MTRSFSRFFLAEGLAILGVFFGAWLIHNAFQPTSDLPVAAPVLLGGLDIFICFGMLGALLRMRLRDGERLPKAWIVGAVVVASAFLGWTLALLLDAERIRAELHGQADEHLAQGDLALAPLQRARWHAVGAMAVTDVFVLLGTVGFWLVLDRELRRRGKAQARLSDSEAHFRSLVEHQPDAVAVLDDKANIIYTNPAWQTAFNYQPDDLQGRNLFELVHPADRTQVQVAYDKQDVDHPIACRLSADYGIWHDVEMQCQEHDGNNTTAVRFRNLRETAETPAAPEPAILKLPDPLLAQEVPALVYTYDPATRRFLSVSNFPGQTLGHPAPNSAAAPDFLMSLVHPDDAARVFHALSLHGDHGEQAVLEDEIRLRDSDGQYQWFGVYHHALPRKIVGVAFPIQRHKRAEELRAEAQRQVHALTESEQKARADLDALAEHKKAHESALREHAHKHKHLEKTLRERDEHRKKLEDDLNEHKHHRRELEDELRDREERCRKLEHRMRDYDRQREELEATVRDHQDRLHGLHESHERHASSLQAGKEAMRRLASGVANDFNKILSVILGYTDVLRENFPKDHMAQNYVDEMRQAANHGAELTQKLLAFSRNHLLQMTPVEMNHQLAALEPKLQEAVGRDVKLEWDRADEELWVKTDPHPLEQALVHLLDHARQRLPHGATLAIRTRRVELSQKNLTHADMAPGSYVQIRLHEHTSEMDEATRQHLFEPYFSAKDGQKSDLGLATANGIVRQSGGCIDVESEPGHGSEIVINLPSTDERPQAAAVA